MTRVPSEDLCDKAARIVATDGVALAPEATTYRVRGDHDFYVVTLEEGQTPVCTCPSRFWMCSHVGAALIVQHEAREAVS